MTPFGVVVLGGGWTWWCWGGWDGSVCLLAGWRAGGQAGVRGAGFRDRARWVLVRVMFKRGNRSDGTGVFR